MSLFGAKARAKTFLFGEARPGFGARTQSLGDAPTRRTHTPAPCTHILLLTPPQLGGYEGENARLANKAGAAPIVMGAWL